MENNQNDFYAIPDGAEVFHPKTGWSPVVENPHMQGAVNSFQKPGGSFGSGVAVVPVVETEQAQVSEEMKEVVPVSVPVVQVTSVKTDEQAPLFSPSELFSLDYIVPSAPISKEFCIQGKMRTFQINPNITQDNEIFIECIQSMYGTKPEIENGVIKVEPITIIMPPPDSRQFTIKHQGYISNLRACSVACITPKMSVQEWAVLGKKIGAKGEQAGWHGIQDIIIWVLKTARLQDLTQLEDEKSAGEGAQQANASTE